MLNEFADRRVIVTGAGRGIGAAIAAYFRGAGALVAAVDTQFEESAESASAHNGPALIQITADLGRVEDLDLIVERCDAALGGLDILVNCAAVYPVHPALDISRDVWDRVLTINLTAPFLLAQGFARRLIAAGRPGHIVNITSGNAERARAGAAHYCASKAGLELVSKTLAIEFAKHRIHVNAVSPGFIDTNSPVNPMPREYIDAISATIPWPRLGEGDDIAKAVGFLCSSQAEWITGISLRVDGGRAAGNTSLPMATMSQPATVPA